MGGLDWILIAIYLLIMLGIGFTSMKKVKTNEDYALAGRSVGNFWVILSLFASWTGLSGLFGTPQYVYQYGIAGWWWWVTFPGRECIPRFPIPLILCIPPRQFVLSLLLSPCGTILRGLQDRWPELFW